MDDRYRLLDTESQRSPSLLFYRSFIESNLRRALELVGDPARLRPHVKTHKTAEIVRMEQARGITKHKCATLREAEMLAQTGATDVLLAYPIVGPNRRRLADLMSRFSSTEFKALVDDIAAAEALSRTMTEAGLRLKVLVDLDVGMHRTGIAPGEGAIALYRRVAELPGLEPYGLHAYDGHNRATVVSDRDALSEECLETARGLRRRLERDGLPVPLLVMGGTPPFPFYAKQTDVESSPGTFVLHDCGYGDALPDLGFVPAALLFSRVISRPTAELATIDLGHKAIAADPIGARGAIWNVPGAVPKGQSEEHWVIELTDPTTRNLKVGTPVYVCPTHICPTVALHTEAHVVVDGRVLERWKIAARDRI
jgi:D-serine deaminase-like pyridoxal phosphate-dependent protein